MPLEHEIGCLHRRLADLENAKRSARQAAVTRRLGAGSNRHAMTTIEYVALPAEERARIERDLDNQEKREALRLAGVVLDKVGQRIAIRFGREHKVTATYAAGAEAMVKVYGTTQFPGFFELSDREQRMRNAGQEFEQLWPAFMDAATAYAGVELAAQP